ncbi:MAG TPA: SurA N-terminal domain-containing protein, partial [Desulfosarcina sp.]|nr:SurA N-terminal domain-containing protein [Desulfosarcina sp.]
MTFNRIKIALPAAVAAVLLFIPAVAPAADAADAQIAQVNGAVLMRQDLDREMKLVSMKLARQGRPIDDAQLKRYEGNIRETLISRTLLLQQSQALDISVKESLVDKALDEFKTGFKDDAAYRQALADMGFTQATL